MIWETWSDAGRVAEVRRDGATEVCEASGAGRCWIIITDITKGLKVSAAVEPAGVYWRFYRQKDGRLVWSSRSPDHEHLFRRVLSALSAMGRV